MAKCEYRVDGPWTSEPDELRFTDEATGYACHIARVGHSGHLCGYVRIPAGHPLHGVGYGDPAPSGLAEHVERVRSGPTGKRGAIDMLCFALGDGAMSAGLLFNVHGGITYSEQEDDGYWYGFDCAHSGDLCPASRYAFDFGGPSEYRDIEYVKGECASLAAQLHRLAA